MYAGLSRRRSAAACAALPGYGPVTAQNAEAREDYDAVYACSGVVQRAGEVLLVARYAGGPRESAARIKPCTVFCVRRAPD
ncbi:MAG: hypothetical protein DHS20C06_08910 [Hyphobacterium sp.]|nr:MAG: hypothetical protein DHS20C06_08910 [Hyphobacterium sp.]